MAKRLALLLTLCLTWSTMTTTTAQATGEGPCSERRFNVTRTMSTDVRIAHVKALIRCAFTWAGIPEEIDTAYYVASRESGMQPWATNPVASTVCRPYSANPYGSCGLFQHLARYWPGRVSAYLHERWFPHTWPHVPVLQARANVMVTAIMVKQGGWSPWSS